MAAFSGDGAGTQGSPYLIKTYDQLREFGQDLACTGYLSAHWKLYQDINASASNALDDGKGWKPVGTITENPTTGVKTLTPFTGSFNGNNKTISNLTINRPDESYVGLFGYVDSAFTIENLTLSAVNVVGLDMVGALIGFNKSATIKNCKVSSGTVIGGA